MHRLFAAAMLLSVLSALAAGQSIPGFAVFPYGLETGVLSNPTNDPQRIPVGIVTSPGATSMRLKLAAVRLDTDEDALVFTHPLTTDTQRLSRGQLKQWQNTTAWFNGDTILVFADVAPGSNVAFDIAEIVSPMPVPPEGLSGICGGVDDRIFTNSTTICRLLSSCTSTGGGCTGSLVDNGLFCLSAGHCADPFPDFLVCAEFNVPLSTSSGAIAHPSSADQYPVDTGSIVFENGGAGADWAVFRLHPNSSGETAFARQGTAYALATSLPPLTTSLRTRGFGTHSTPTLNFAPHTSTGPYVGQVPFTDILEYQVDVDNGDSGSTLLIASSSDVIGIVTHTGCSTFANQGTSLFRQSLQTAIANVRACGATTLTNSASATQLSCEPRLISIVPSTSSWNIVAVSDSNDDYDIQIGTVLSSFGSNACDFLVAEGQFGSPGPVNAWVTGVGSVSSGDVQFRIATLMLVGSINTIPWGTNQLVEIREFNTTAGSYDITVGGDPGFNWRIYRDDGTPFWRPRSGADISGAVNGGTLNGVALPAGKHALVIFKNGEPGAATPATFNAVVAPATTGVTLSSAGTPVAITNATQDFLVTPGAGEWNAVSISSTSDWNIAIGSGYDLQTGSLNAFAVADGHAGTIAPGGGVFDRASGAAAGVAQHRLGSNVTVNDPFGGTAISTGLVMRIYEFDAGAGGTFDIGVTGGSGDANLNWRLFAPDGSSAWRGRSAYTQSGDVGGPLLTGVSLGAGWHALVVFLDGGPNGASENFTVHVSNTVTPAGLAAGSGISAVPTSHKPFSLTGTVQGQWNAVAAVGTATNDCDIHLATGDSDTLGNGECEFVISNGNLGTVPLGPGVAVRDVGTDPWCLLRAAVTPTFISGHTFTRTNFSDIIHVFEFDITTPGDYAVTTTGGSGVLQWSVFAPGTGAAWRSRDGNDGTGVFGTPQTITLSQNGRHAFVVHRGCGGSPGITFTAQLAFINPVPTLASISPQTAATGSGPVTLTLTGTGFVSNSVARWNSVNLPTTWVSPTQLSATISASLLTAVGTASISVLNPAPGGGISGFQTFGVEYPYPVVASLSPDSATAGSAQITLTVHGSGFVNGSQIKWNVVGLTTTTFVSATELTCPLSASRLATAGVASVTVVNPSPGGGTSAAQPFTINNPFPVLTGISPTSVPAGQASPATISCTGSGFNPSSVVRFDGAVVAPTIYVLPTEVTLQVPASYLTSGGNHAITVENPTPGGGTSASRTFSVNHPAPTLTSISPDQVTAPSSTFITLACTGTNFVPGCVVESGLSLPLAALPLTTTFLSSTSVSAIVPATMLQYGYAYDVRLRNPAPGGSTSNLLTFTVNNPVPTFTGPAQIVVPAGFPDPHTFVMTGTGFNPTTQAHWNGQSLLSESNSSATHMQVSIPPSLTATAGSASITVFNPSPGGGSASGSVSVEIAAPCLTSVSPSVLTAPLTPASSPVVLTISGLNLPSGWLHPNGFVVYANGVALQTLASGPFGTGPWMATLVPTIPQTQQVGGIVITGVSFGTVTSNQLAIEIEDHNNQGTIERVPVAPSPGEAFDFVMSGAITGAPFTLFADAVPFPPIVGQNSGIVLAVYPSPLNVVFDGMGIHNPPNPIAVFTNGPNCAPSSALGPRFVLPGIVQPNPPFGISLTLQAAYVDPAALHGFTLTHARWPFDL